MPQPTTHTASNNNSVNCMYPYCYESEVNSSNSRSKELYVESSNLGYTYFGARYYESDLSVWLSVDPLASKYPMLSPYAYVFNNPIMFRDLWGLEGEPTTKKKNRNQEEPITMYCSRNPVDIIAKKGSISESKKASFLSTIGKSIRNLFRGIKKYYKEHRFRKADGVVLMNKTLSSGHGEKAKLKPREGQKDWDGGVIYSDYLQVALGLGENKNPSLNVADGIVNLNGFFEAVNDINETSSKKKDKSVPQSKRFPNSIRIEDTRGGSTRNFEYNSEEDSVELMYRLRYNHPLWFTPGNTVVSGNTK